MLEAVDLGSKGFKDLDGGGDVGFHRNEFVLKGAVNSDPSDEIFHELEVRVGYARERSDETYTGITDEDFRDQPLRRYASTARDHMKWWRGQLQIRHNVSIGEHLEVHSVFYRHDLKRTWNRLNRFRDGPSIADVLQAPDGGNRPYYDVLSGQADSRPDVDSSPSSRDLMVIANQRAYVSQGIQSRLRVGFDAGPIGNQLEFGVRLHHDHIDRNHRETGFQMVAGELVPDGEATNLAALDSGNTNALALYAANAFRWSSLTVSPGVRVEIIRTSFRDSLRNESSFGSATVFMPSLSLQYQLHAMLSVFAGIHRGFSPVPPGEPAESLPERSTNYEAGIRFDDAEEAASLEFSAYYNDYSNLSGECSFSSVCAVDDSGPVFNAGEADVFGLEFSGSYIWEPGDDWKVPLMGTYTFTDARFRSSFSSTDSTFGDVQSGDEIPYIPGHQFRVQAGAQSGDWSANASASYIGAMREEPGQGAIVSDSLPRTDAYLLVGGLVSFGGFDPVQLYVRAENVLNQQAVVARRPVGARPLRPLTIMLGARLTIR